MGASARLRSLSALESVQVGASPPKFRTGITELEKVPRGNLQYFVGGPGSINHVSQLPDYLKIPIYGPKQDFPFTIVVPDGIFHALTENPYERDISKHGKKIVAKLQERATTNGKAVAFVDQKGNIWKGDSHTTDYLRSEGRIPRIPSGKVSLDVYYIGAYHVGEDTKTSEMLALYNQFNSRDNVKTAQDNLAGILHALGFESQSTAWNGRGTSALRLADAVLNSLTLPSYDAKKDIGVIASVWLGQIKWHDALATELTGATKWNGGMLAAALLTQRKYPVLALSERHVRDEPTEFWSLVANPPEDSARNEQYNLLNEFILKRAKKRQNGNMGTQAPVVKYALTAFERWRTGDPDATIKVKDYVTN